MARSCGIRIGPRRFELIVLDGSAKKHKISAYKFAEFPAGTDDPLAAASSALKKAAKELDIPRENVGISIDTGMAAFRRLKLPFADKAKIEQVIKYEVESQLPQWNIDDVIVDFQVLTSNDQESELLVSALPKEDLGAVLELCEEAGIEPLDAEFETTAMVNAASAADICHIDDAQLLVHIGETSTSVVVMDAGEVRDMRVIHLGALTHEVQAASKPAVDPNEAGEAGEEGEEGEEAEASGLPHPIDSQEALRRTEQAIKRIRRELGRTLSASGTIHKIDSIYVCGLELPGLIGSTVLDIPVYAFDCFDEDGGGPAEGFGVLIVAYGTAIEKLGGGQISASLRREELRYTGAMERVEFPLAVAALLLCFALGVVNILQFSEVKVLNNKALTWLKSSNNFMVGDPASGKVGALTPVPDDLRKYKKLVEGELKGDPDRTPLEALGYVSSNLQRKIYDLKKETGQEGDVTQPQSAFVGVSLVLGVLEDAKNKWRPSLRKVTGAYERGRAGKNDRTKVTLDLVFFAETAMVATQDFEQFMEKLREETVWFIEADASKVEPLENGMGVHVPNMTIYLDVDAYDESLRGGGEG